MTKPELEVLTKQWRNWAEKVRIDPSVPAPQPGAQLGTLERHPEICKIVQAALRGTAVLQNRHAELRKTAYSPAVDGSVAKAPKASLEELRSCQRAIGTTNAQLSELALQRSQFEEIAKENARLKELAARSKSWVQASLQGQKPPSALRDLFAEKDEDLALEDKLDELDTLRTSYAQISKENEDFQRKTEKLEKDVAKQKMITDMRYKEIATMKNMQTRQDKEIAEMKNMQANRQEVERQKAELEDLRSMVKAAADKDAKFAQMHKQQQKAAEASKNYEEIKREMEEMKRRYEDVSKENLKLKETVMFQREKLQEDQEILEETLTDNQKKEKKLNFLKRSAADTQRRLHGSKAEYLLHDPHDIRSSASNPQDRSKSPANVPRGPKPKGRGSSFFAEHGGPETLSGKLRSMTPASHDFSDEDAF